MAGSKKYKKSDDKKLSYSEMITKRDELKKEYMDLRFQMVVGHVDNPMQKRQMRHEIARLNTFIHQHELEEMRAKAVEAVRSVTAAK